MAVTGATCWMVGAVDPLLAEGVLMIWVGGSRVAESTEGAGLAAGCWVGMVGCTTGATGCGAEGARTAVGAVCWMGAGCTGASSRLIAICARQVPPAVNTEPTSREIQIAFFMISPRFWLMS
jgi:hypothetical protein